MEPVLQYFLLISHGDSRIAPGGLQSAGLQRVGQDIVTKHSIATFDFIFPYFG